MSVAPFPAAPSIVFVLGPWGSGKSSLGRGLAGLGYEHVEIDRWTEGDGIALAGLSGQWGTFAASAWIWPLHDELRGRARGKRGIVLTFPVELVPTPKHYRAMRRSGIHLVICYATAAECLDGWIARERAHGRPADPKLWIANNAEPYARYSAPEHAAHRLTTFRDGAFLGAESIAASTVARIDRRATAPALAEQRWAAR